MRSSANRMSRKSLHILIDRMQRSTESMSDSAEQSGDTSMVIDDKARVWL